MFYALSKLGFLILRPSNALLIALALGLGLRLTPLARRGAQLFGLAFVLLLLCSFSGLPDLMIAPLERRFPLPAEAPRTAPRGIVVLGGVIDTRLSTARGSAEFLDGAERLIAAAQLARRYPEALVVFSGGSSGLFDNGQRPEADFARGILEGFGVEPQRIVVEDRSRNTLENARFTFDVVEPREKDRWILVTSAFHMPRAIGTFRAAGWTGLTAWPVDYRTPPVVSFLDGQYASDGLSLTDLAIREWIGLAAYRFAGYTDALLPAP